MSLSFSLCSFWIYFIILLSSFTSFLPSFVSSYLFPLSFLPLSFPPSLPGFLPFPFPSVLSFYHHISIEYLLCACTGHTGQGSQPLPQLCHFLPPLQVLGTLLLAVPWEARREGTWRGERRGRRLRQKKEACSSAITLGTRPIGADSRVSLQHSFHLEKDSLICKH